MVFIFISQSEALERPSVTLRVAEWGSHLSVSHRRACSPVAERKIFVRDEYPSSCAKRTQVPIRVIEFFLFWFWKWDFLPFHNLHTFQPCALKCAKLKGRYNTPAACRDLSVGGFYCNNCLTAVGKNCTDFQICTFIFDVNCCNTKYFIV